MKKSWIYLLFFACFALLLGCSPQNQKAKMKAKAEKSLLDCAIFVADKIQEPYEKCGALGKILESKYAGRKQFDQILPMVTALGEDISTKPTCLGELAVCYAKVKDKRKALEILNKITDPEKKTNAYYMVVGEFAKAGDYKEGVELADKMTDAYYKARALASVAGEALKDKQFGTALNVMNTIENAQEKTTMLLKIASDYAKAGEKDKAQPILSQALQAADAIAEPNAKMVTIAIDLLPADYATISHYEQARKITEAAADSPYKAYALADIAVVYAKVGKKEEALQLLSQALDIAKKSDDPVFPRPKVLACVAEKYIEVGQYAEPLEIAKLLGQEPYDEGRFYCSWIVAAYAKAVQNDRVVEVVGMIKDPLDGAKAFVEAAGEYIKKGEKEQAAAVLSRALQLARPTQDGFLKASALVDIAAKYGELGERDQANQVLSSALQVAEAVQNVKDSHMDTILHMIAGSNCANDAIREQAFQMALKLSDPILKENVLGDFAGVYAQAGQYEKAIEAAKDIRSPLSLMHTLRNIAEKRVAQKEGDAGTVLSQLVTVAQTIDEGIQTGTMADIAVAGAKSGALMDVANAYVSIGEKEKGYEVLAQALEAASVLADDDASKGMRLVEIATDFAKAGRYDQALEVIKKIPIGLDKVNALVNVMDQFPQEKQSASEDERKILRDIVASL